ALLSRYAVIAPAASGLASAILVTFSASSARPPTIADSTPRVTSRSPSVLGLLGMRLLEDVVVPDELVRPREDVVAFRAPRHQRVARPLLRVRPVRGGAGALLGALPAAGGLDRHVARDRHVRVDHLHPRPRVVRAEVPGRRPEPPGALPARPVGGLGQPPPR